MRLSQTFFKTYKEDPQDAEIKSHKLLVRAGYIKKQGAGLYIYLPLAVRVLEKLKNVIREELNKAGAIEVEMTKLVQEDIYSHRIAAFGPDMYRLKDRTGKDMCLGPTHEELFTLLVKDAITSHKQLPIVLYQIATKFRDEIRPRFGLQRAKEFVMQDAYSYDKDRRGMLKSFNNMKKCYDKIFTRLGLNFVSVEADNGVMGGSGSREFMVINDAGEDTILICNHCHYAANVEKAPALPQINTPEKPLETKLVYTPNCKTIEDVAKFLKLDIKRLIKAVAYRYDKGTCVAFVRGDREIEEVKLKNLLHTNNLTMASSEDITKIGSVAGFIGAQNLKKVKIVYDNEIKSLCNFVIGANKTDYHYINVHQADLMKGVYSDIRQTVAGDICPLCGHTLDTIRGIEVGHIFKNDEVYTKALDCKYLDENGQAQYMQMGCYGIGVSRTLSAVVEQYSDDKGIVWPEIIAPYKVGIIIANTKDENIVAFGEQLYKKCNKEKVLLDDRKESFGTKFKDLELIGLPYIIIVGKLASEGKVELVNRRTDERQVLTLAEAVKFVNR